LVCQKNTDSCPRQAGDRKISERLGKAAGVSQALSSRGRTWLGCFRACAPRAQSFPIAASFWPTYDRIRKEERSGDTLITPATTHARDVSVYLSTGRAVPPGMKRRYAHHSSSNHSRFCPFEAVGPHTGILSRASSNSFGKTKLAGNRAHRIQAQRFHPRRQILQLTATDGPNCYSKHREAHRHTNEYGTRCTDKRRNMAPTKRCDRLQRGV
jgi:hypothetical protein